MLGTTILEHSSQQPVVDVLAGEHTQVDKIESGRSIVLEPISAELRPVLLNLTRNQRMSGVP